MIEKTEKEGDQTEETNQGQTSAFAFAKVWAADKDVLTEMNDEASENGGEVGDSWAQVLAKLEVERSKAHAQEVTGRGAKRKAAPSFLPKVGLRSPTVIVGAHICDRTPTLLSDLMVPAPRTAQRNPRKRKGRRSFQTARSTAPLSILPISKARAEVMATQRHLMTW